MLKPSVGTSRDNSVATRPCQLPVSEPLPVRCRNGRKSALRDAKLARTRRARRRERAGDRIRLRDPDRALDVVAAARCRTKPAPLIGRRGRAGDPADCARRRRTASRAWKLGSPRSVTSSGRLGSGRPPSWRSYCADALPCRASRTVARRPARIVERELEPGQLIEVDVELQPVDRAGTTCAIS